MQWIHREWFIIHEQKKWILNQKITQNLDFIFQMIICYEWKGTQQFSTIRLGLVLSSCRYLHNSSSYLTNQNEAINIEKTHISSHEVRALIHWHFVIMFCCNNFISFLFWLVILSDYIIEFKITICSIFSYKYETKGSFQFHLSPSNSSIHSLGHLQVHESENKFHARFDSLQQKQIAIYCVHCVQLQSIRLYFQWVNEFRADYFYFYGKHFK